MRYPEAVALAEAGKWVRRPHWHWVYLTSRKAGEGRAIRDTRVLIIVDEDGKEQERFTSRRADRDADDWEKVE